jgi:hypothetical protein
MVIHEKSRKNKENAFKFLNNKKIKEAANYLIS